MLKINSNSPKDHALVFWFEDVGIDDISLVGGKNASLGEMIQQLSPKGVNVPTGFATTAYAYRHFIRQADLDDRLRQLFSDLDVEDINNLRKRGKQARAMILHTPFPPELETAIVDAYLKLCERYNGSTEFCDRLEGKDYDHCRHYSGNVDVAVRSSATAEDLPDASFAGTARKPTSMSTGSKAF